MKSEQKNALIVLLVFGIIAVGACAYVWLFYPGVQGMIQDARTKEREAEEQARSYQMKLNEIKAFREIMESPEYQLVKERVEELEKRLPTTQQANLFYEALTDALLVTGVTNTLLERQEIKEHSVRYEEIPYKLEAIARYHQFGQFLNIVEENPDRFMRVKSLVLSTDDEDPTLHPIDVQIATFRFISRN
ncbi:MAG: type 4a pilus biogenesis protein PilO [Candidatus Sumerlaeota bacterium]